jgi:hypothetical protein
VNENGNIKTLKPFQKGVSGNPHRGPSKVSTKVKESLVKFLEDNIDAVQESFDKLKPLEKLQFVANILPYVVPKLQSVESDNKTNITGGITIRWEEPDLQAGQDKSSVSYLQSFQAGSEDNNQSGGDQIDQDI